MNVDVLIASLPRLAAGLSLTLQLLALGLIAGGVMALPLALARLSAQPALRWAATGYSWFFRGTPLLVQMFLIYYGSGQFRPQLEAIGLWPLLREAYWCAILTFALNTAAYTGEILRGGILAVPRGEIEAARALGLRTVAVYRHIILPRAYRMALPAYGNEIVLMLKGSALASAIALADLMGVARSLYSRTFAFEIYLLVGLVYFVLTFLIGRTIHWLEWYLAREARASGKT